MDNKDGLICSYLLDNKGGGEEVTLGDMSSADHLVWVHLDRAEALGKHWYEHIDLDPYVRFALFESENMSTERWTKEGRPRCIAFEEGVIISLRGANLNPDSVASDMVGVRLWISPQKIVSVRRRHLMAIDDIRTNLADGKGPRTPGEFVVMLTTRLLERMEPLLTEFRDQIDDLEQSVITDNTTEIRGQTTNLHRDVIQWKRHIAPQRDALKSLLETDVNWLNRHDRAQLNQLVHDTNRHVEDLDVVRERAIIIQNEISHRLTEQMNRSMYKLSFIAAVFLPLSFMTGLFGMNLTGPPFPEVDATLMFWLACLGMFFIGGIAWLILRRFNSP